MKLTDLHPVFLRHCIEDGKDVQYHDVSRDQADGIMFHCPLCTKNNGRPEGAHMIICWEPSVPDRVSPHGGRWRMEGTGFDDLTLVNGSSSVLLLSGCCAHFWIRNGEIIFC